MKFLALVFSLLSSTAFARAPDFDGMVQLTNGLKVYCQEYKARGSAPTIVLLHGLTYTTKPWAETVSTLAQKDYGVLVYDMRGMGKTLEANGEVTSIITLQQQVDDLALLLDNRGLTRVSLAGLSYGGAVGLAFAEKHPQRVEQLVLLAPYVKALAQQDAYLQNQVKMYKMMHPQDRRPDDEIYDECLQKFIYANYPVYEPVIKEHPWRIGAVFQMVRGVRKFKATDILRGLTGARIHLVMAGRDQYVPAADLLEFWNALGSGNRQSRIVVAGSEHKLPEAVPHYLAGWLGLATEGDQRLSGGREFQGSPQSGTAVSGSVRIEGLPTER